MNNMMTSPEIMASVTEIKAKNSVRTQYVVRVVKVSNDGRFVNVMHCNLEWKAGVDGDSVIINSMGKPVLASPTKPWIIHDVPVEQTYLRGQWQINARPRVGDYGILSVFYHDIESWKKNGGFQAPTAIRIHALDSCSFRPGLPNHKDVSAETTTYPNDDKMEIKGNGVSISLTAPNNQQSEEKEQIIIKAGKSTITVTATGDDESTIHIHAGSYDHVITDSGDVEETMPNKTVEATSSLTVETPTMVVDGTLQVTNGASGLIYTGAQVITVTNGIVTNIS